MDDVQITSIWDSIGRSSSAARHTAVLEMARHLRWEHKLSQRAVAQRLNVKVSWVREYVDAWKEKQDG
jgi:hypothetical protein